MRADDITSRFIPMTSLSIVSCLRQLLESKSDTLLNNLFILTTLTNCILGKGSIVVSAASHFLKLLTIRQFVQVIRDFNERTAERQKERSVNQRTLIARGKYRCTASLQFDLLWLSRFKQQLIFLFGRMESSQTGHEQYCDSSENGRINRA